MSRAVVIGLDGAAWHLLRPMLERGVMPRLQELTERAAAGILTSTIPTYTPPAWTSAVTGVNPGRHGVYGFVESHAQREPRLMHSGKIKAPALWDIANAQETRVGVYNLPLTYPPQEIEGWMVSGMMTPGYGDKLKGFASPAHYEAEILQWAPDYVVDISANYEQDWRDTELCDRALRSIEQRRVVLSGLLELDPVDLLFTVLEAPDRLQHVYYRYLDPEDPGYHSDEATRIRPAVERCFTAMDEIVGMLVDYAGSDGYVIVCSDHGFTAWEVSVHVNALLADWGYLRLKPIAAAMQTEAARRAVGIAKRFMPRRLAREAKGKTFAAIDWNRTKAFASPIPQQGVFVNLHGREPYGIVPRSELDAVKDDLVRRFQELLAPDGRPATDEIHRSEDVFSGDALEGAPDVLPVLRDHRYELDDELFHRDPFSDVGHLPRGVHHPRGIGILAGPGIVSRPLDASVMDVLPTLLHMAGLKVPEGLDGRVITSAYTDDFLRDRPVQTTPPLSSTSRDDSSPYSQEEEAIIEESLRGLGYL